MVQPAQPSNLMSGENFDRVLQALKKKGCITSDELELIHEMRKQGAINTMWLKRNYREGEIQEEDYEIVEEFKPLSFGQYHALYAIASGSYGIVYKGFELGTEKIVAIKRLNPNRVSSSRERFIREVGLLKKLSHPNILPILAGGEQDGEYFLVAPFICGGSLEQKIAVLPSKRSLADLASLFAIVIQVGKALEYAHQKGIVHRDVKPANILLEKDHPYLADFGLAREIEDTAKITKGAVGTPTYMAPELWERKVLPQTDIYSLGVILYEIVCGQYPFPGQTPEQILAKQITSVPKNPVTPDSPLPQSLNGTILKSLLKDPAQRYASMTVFLQELMKMLKDVF